MSYLHTDVLDSGLGVLHSAVDKSYICSSEPATYTAATSTYALGSKNWGAGNAVGSPASRSPSGRKVSTVAITDGSVTGGGTAAYWALVDSGTSRLLAAYSLSASQVVSSGNVYTLGSFDIGIPAPA